MARYKDYNYDQAKLLPISFSRQILPGTFEYSLNHLIDHELDLSVFDARYRNDETGAPAYDPAILLKIVLYAYSRGITSSRDIEQCCRENVVFFKDRSQSVKQSYATKMKQKIDTPEGRQQYSRRLGIVEPVFAHLTSQMGLKRFSLRGRLKVNIQWKLFCIVHNLTKIHRYGYGGS